MQNRTQARRAALTIAHHMPMPRHTDSAHDGRPITFRVQADRRQLEALAAGIADRRARRKAAVAAAGVTDIDKGARVDDRVDASAADSAQEK